MLKLSYSACEKYLSSPFSYFAHYHLRLRSVELSSALFFGAAVDDGLNALLALPLDRSPLALVKAKEVFDASWTTSKVNEEDIVLSTPGAIKFSKAERLEAEEAKLPVWESMKNKGHMLLEAYATQIVPRIKEVISVQEKIDLKNEFGDSFTGLIDLVVRWEDNRIILFDNKTTSVRYKSDSVENSEQLSTYWEAVAEKYKLDAAGYIAIPKKIRKKKEPLVPIEVIIGDIPESLVEQTFDKYEAVVNGIKTGQFPCTPEGCCSKPWPCSYKSFCASGGTNTTGLVVYKERKK